MAMPDLTVRGAGIFGLSVAWACALRGARVRVIEAAHVGAGASGGIVGALAPHVPENWNPKKAFQLESLLMAEGWWAGVETASGLPAGYARTGRLQPLADARAVEAAQVRAEGAAALWQGRAEWRVERAADGWVPHSPSGWVVHDTLTARVHPRMGCAALVAAIRARGGEVISGEAPEAGPVVWATGVAGLAALSAATGRVVGGAVKGQALALRHDAADLPQLFVDGLHIVPHGDGTVAVGSTSERVWDEPAATDAELDALLARAVAACPVLAGAAVVERWAGLRPRANSRAPMLGPWPGRPGHFIANGGFKIGFGMAPKVGEVMADLALDGRDTIPDGFGVAASM
ncbi:FAD-dependent oxidoreductase [Fertoebacter nigrum]|uniref:FAD-dependent oxidoreductase n=1 Tax=Fertoeibacter niger TaxID=2656921 RepID=A0A8X8GX80_9RHOB|nr:FAD-dependent oxidoreductase [Fertoeibacter niger]NUB46014.1 FAD-dependent oxidoreductase [Fertoeibacter niger]